ncbi:MAG: hypothetical protein IKS83_07050, partial [Victivallales bacterium]|nr:hypothetical protein [Victivallales bacterium]
QRAIREWLAECHIGGYAACCGLPQTDVNTVISDFPPVHNHEQLTRMVEYQTRQLDGLSGEQFLHAFQPLIPLPGQTNPLLIAMSRETLLEERLQHFQAMGLHLEQMTSSGLALLNAFEILQPAAAEQPCLQLVADFGAEHSVLAIYCQGRVQQVATIALGFEPTAENPPATLGHAFAHEVQVVLQGWKATQADERNLQLPDQLWLSGAGALNPEVAELLAADLQVPVHLLGIPARKCAAGLPTGGAIGGVCPALTIAFGLAIQGTGNAPYDLSLIPERLAWQQRKLAACPFLFLSVAVLIVAICVGLRLFTSYLRPATEQLQVHEAELDEAFRIGAQLEKAYQQLDHFQKKLLPIAEIGFRTQRFMETLEVWVQALERSDARETWCFYLADEFSFSQANTMSLPKNTRRGSRDEETTEHAGRIRSSRTPDTAPTTRPADTPAEEGAENVVRIAPQTEPDPAVADSPEQTIVYPPVTLVTQLPSLTCMYIGGYVSVPSRGDKYEMVKTMQKRLNDSHTFVNVDDCANKLSPAFVETYRQPWEEFLAEHHDALKQEYLDFFLKLPFRETPVKRPPN